MGNFKMTIYKSLREGAEALRPKTAQLKRIQEEIDSGRFTRETIEKELRPEADELKRDIDKAGHAAILATMALVNQYRADVEAGERLDPAAIDDNDMKLLRTGLLRANDIEALLSKNSGNRTMCTLISRFAQDNGIEISQESRARLGMEHNAAFEEIETAETVTSCFEKWIGDRDSIRILNSFFGMTEQQATAAEDEE